MHDFLATHLHAGYGCICHADDAVASQDADAFAWSLWHGLYDEQRVLQHVELYADTLEGAFQRLGELLGVSRVSVSRVRVEFGEYAVDGVFRELLRVHAIDVEVVYHNAGHDELLHVLLQVVGCIVVRWRVAEAPLCREAHASEQRDDC